MIRIIALMMAVAAAQGVSIGQGAGTLFNDLGGLVKAGVANKANKGVYTVEGGEGPIRWSINLYRVDQVAPQQQAAVAKPVLPAKPTQVVQEPAAPISVLPAEPTQVVQEPAADAPISEGSDYFYMPNPYGMYQRRIPAPYDYGYPPYGGIYYG